MPALISIMRIARFVKKIIDDIQIKVYDYEHYMIYLFQYYDTFITMMGVLPEQEFDKIVTGFHFK